jgi:hypothetical protein
MGRPRGDEGEVDTHTPEFLSWRRLHLAKSKLSNVSEVASFMSGFAVVSFIFIYINIFVSLLTCY